MSTANGINLNAFKEKAEAGDAAAQYEMAFIENEYADPIMDSGERSLTWLEKAANQGHSDAQLAMGLYYLYKSERKLIGKRFEDQHGSSKKNTPLTLAVSLVIAKLFEVNNDKAAVEWLSKAAKQENRDAQFWLAHCYYHGFGTEQNHEASFELFKQSAEQGSSDAMLFLALSYREEKGVESNNSLALHWLNKAVELNNDYAIYLMGFMYENGRGVTKNLKTAFGWYEKAAYLNNADAQYIVALEYISGRCVEKDYTQSWEWMEKAADNGHDKAKQEMIIHCLQQAANYGSPEAHLALSQCYQRGKGVEKYPDMAIAHLDRSLYLDKNGHNLSEESSLIDIELRALLAQLKSEGKIDNETASQLEIVSNAVYKEKLNLQIRADKRREDFDKAILEKEREMLSFFTHTMRNALATAPESLRQAIHLLGSEVYEKDTKHYQAINKIAALFSTLSLTDCLIDTFKQSISDPQEFKQSWQKDHAGDATLKWVVASALRQSLNRIIFMSDTTELRKLLNNPETALIKATRKSFIEEVLPLNVDSLGVDVFYAWTDKHISAIDVSIADCDKLNFGVNQIRFSLLFAITSELILNALKYWDGENRIQISWQLAEQDNYVFSVKNHCKANATSNLAGTHKGLAFIKRLVELLGEQAQFVCKSEDQLFTAELILNKALFKGES